MNLTLTRNVNTEPEIGLYTYEKYVDANASIWLVRTGKFSADGIYVSGGKDSKGFGGAILKFKLTDGTFIELKGPWLTNAKDLQAHTGISVGRRYSSRVVIYSGKMKTDKNHYSFTDVHYGESEFVEGTFDREETLELAKNCANSTGKSVFYFKETNGGHISFVVHPKVIKRTYRSKDE